MLNQIAILYKFSSMLKETKGATFRYQLIKQTTENINYIKYSNELYRLIINCDLKKRIEGDKVANC